VAESERQVAVVDTVQLIEAVGGRLTVVHRLLTLLLRRGSGLTLLRHSLLLGSVTALRSLLRCRLLIAIGSGSAEGRLIALRSLLLGIGVHAGAAVAFTEQSEVTDRDVQALGRRSVIALVLLNLCRAGNHQHRIVVFAGSDHVQEALGDLLPHRAVGPHHTLFIGNQRTLTEDTVQSVLAALNGHREVDVGLALAGVLHLGATGDSTLEVHIDEGLTVGGHSIGEMTVGDELTALLLTLRGSTLLRIAALLGRRLALRHTLLRIPTLSIALRGRLLGRIAVGGLTLRSAVLRLRGILALRLRIPILRSLLHTTVVVLIRHNFLLSSARRRTKS